MNTNASNVGTRVEPLSRQPTPAAKQSVNDLNEQVAYHRAFEAVPWAMPAVAIYRFRCGLLEQPGMADNVVTAYSGPLHTNHELITANVFPRGGRPCEL